ncbi:MAG: tyrosine-type recombinase/integrase [Geobacteraceae bacterium]
MSSDLVVFDGKSMKVQGPHEVSTSELLRAFFSCKSAKTLIAYRQDIEDFSIFMNQPGGLNSVVETLLARGHGLANALVLSYISDMQRRGLAAATINRRLAALRSLVSLANTLGIISWKIEIGNVKSEPYRDTSGPGSDAIVRMMQYLKNWRGAKAHRDYAIIRLLYDLALRREEVASLDLKDVELERRELLVLGKGRVEKCRLSLPKPTAEALSQWLHIRGVEPGPLFTNFDRAGKGARLTATSIYRLVRGLGKTVGAKVRPHGIRHSAITTACLRAQANGIPLEEVLDFSRHKDVATLLIYRDRERNAQGQIASLVADEISA